MMVGRLLLPPSYFSCPCLSPEAIKEYADVGVQSAETLIHKAALVGGTYDWQLYKYESEVKMYKQRGRRALERPSRYCGVMQVVGKLDEYIDLYRYDTTDQARAYFRRFGGAYVDVAVLHTIAPCRPDRPNDATRIKWCLLQSPLATVKRDFVILETDLEFQVDGKRAWVRAYRSIDLAGFPDTRQELHCRRGRMYDMGHVVVESDRPGYLDLTYVADMDIHSTAPAWLVDLSFKLWLRSMSEIDWFMRENRLSQSPFRRSSQLEPLTSCSTCSLCRHKFGLLRKRTNCFKCGDVVCRACNCRWNVKIDGYNVRIRACLPCSLAVAAWTPTSSRSTTAPQPSILFKTPLRALLERRENGDAVDDDDGDAVQSADQSSDRQVNPIMLNTHSTRGLPHEDHPK
ncbi:hypothetical protein AeRB84_021063 [Aphanomyces euteiches]|nr:hypothetical protein AeRB84_021063 [Aphanomyces euteiches]